MERGFLYVAMGERYVQEAIMSARSLKRFTQLPVCLITDNTQVTSPYFDKIIIENADGDFVSKIIGMQYSPFERTVFLDTDTFVCSSIDPLFEILDLFDMAMSVGLTNHSYSFFERYNPSYKLVCENVLPEYNTGVVVFKKNKQVIALLEEWLTLHLQMQIKADMPSFREAFIKHVTNVHIAPLPLEYNYQETHSFGFAHREIKVIHERLGERWNTLTTVMLPFEQMDKRAKKINKYHCKRIIVPYLGVIPYTYSPYRIKYKIKSFLGIKRTKKAKTF